MLSSVHYADEKKSQSKVEIKSLPFISDNELNIATRIKSMAISTGYNDTEQPNATQNKKKNIILLNNHGGTSGCFISVYEQSAGELSVIKKTTLF